MRRLDQALVERGLCESREKAKRAVLAGQVRINERLARKSSDPVRQDDQLTLATGEKFVSRGGLKLEHGLVHFHLDVSGLTAIDLGASTGGFADCLLQRGASKVYAVDVGRGQLAWKLRRDPRVVVMERTNAMHLRLPEPVDLVCIDVGWTRQRHILPSAARLLKPDGIVVTLVKPHYEADPSLLRKGILPESSVDEILRSVKSESEPAGWTWLASVRSPIRGTGGNVEVLVMLRPRT